MKNILLILCAFALIFSVEQEIYGQELNIIPQPNQITIKKTDGFKVNTKTTIVVNAESKSIGKQLQSLMETDYNMALKISEREKKNNISFQINADLNKEAYQIDVNSKGIVIRASGKSGWFYGVQSLRQLLRNSLETSGQSASDLSCFR